MSEAELKQMVIQPIPDMVDNFQRLFSRWIAILRPWAEMALTGTCFSQSLFHGFAALQHATVG
jgi:hypothetical protein